MVEFTPVPFCEEWASGQYDKREESDQEAYIASELIRLESIGAPMLRALLACGEQWCQHVAFRLLREGTTSRGAQVPQLAQVYLRLVEPERLDWEGPNGETATAVAIPPPRDPQGLPIERAMVGKLLRAKVGNLGGNLDPSRDAKAAAQFGGDKRQIAAKAHRPLYVTRDITREAKPFSVRDALIILDQWGYGIGETVFRQPRTQDGKTYTMGQCCWLVEEVSAEVAMRDQEKAAARRRAANPSAPATAK